MLKNISLAAFISLRHVFLLLRSEKLQFIVTNWIDIGLFSSKYDAPGLTVGPSKNEKF